MKIKHKLSKIEHGFTCTACQWSWTNEPTSKCPGIRRYRYDPWPEGMRTYTQLRREKLQPGVPPDGCYLRQKEPCTIYLYDLSKAVPRRISTPKQLEAIQKMRACLDARHTCKECKYFDEGYGRRKYGKVNKAGYCVDCQRQIDHQPYQAEVCQWAAELFQGEFIVVDGETTALSENGRNDEIIEFSIVHSSGVVLFSSLIKPQEQREAHDMATHIHGITPEMLESAPTFPEVWPTIQSILRRYRTVLVYNAIFDHDMLKATAARYGYKVPGFTYNWPDHRERWPWQCVMQKFALYAGVWDDYYGSYSWWKLTEAYKNLYGHNYEGQSHRATSNALQTLAILQELARRSDTEVMQEARRAEKERKEERKRQEADYNAAYSAALDEHPF